MAAVLSAFGSAIWIEHRAHLHLDIVIAAVAMTMVLGRVQRGAHPRDRLIGTAVLVASAACASEVSSLIHRFPLIGDAAFTAAMAATIWIRRFGPQATKAGTVVVVPFITLLVAQGQGATSHAASYDLWCALIALVAAFWVAVYQVGAAAWGFHEQRPRPPAPPSLITPSGAKRVPASTRMACQMTVALGSAFAVGRLAFHDHWPWAVLTAFIVCSGARGRGDVLHKGVLRAAGAGIGTVVATTIAGAFPPGDPWSVVIIFAALGTASWLREISYVYWAGSVTAVLSLLYGYFGQNAPALLETRLEAILLGAALGIAASWYVLPVRTGDVLKRRTAEALAALSAFLSSPHGDHTEIRRRQAHFQHAVTQLEQIAKPLRAHRILTGAAQRADTIDAMHTCVEPVRTLASVFASIDTDADTDTEPAWEPLRRAVAANVGAIRRALGSKPGEPYRRIEANPSSPAGSALTALDAALAELSRFEPRAAPLSSRV